VVGFKFKRGFKIFLKMALENWKKKKKRKKILFAFSAQFSRSRQPTARSPSFLSRVGRSFPSPARGPFLFLPRVPLWAEPSKLT
jgi:hypothetical protein